MRKTMIRNSLLMLLVTAVFAGALMLYLRSAGSVSGGEASTDAVSYTASAEGFCSDVVVTASFANGALVDLTIDASGETESLGGAAATELTTAMLAAGGTGGVDAVASATITSDAIFAAYADCAAQAGIVSGDVYTATAAGFASDVVVTATYADGVIVALSIDASGETPEYGGAAAEALTETIVAAGSTDGVDAFASATITSDAIFAALADCASQAGSEEEEEEVILSIEEVVVTPGEDIYSATATGYSSDISVTLSYTDGISVAINAEGETPELGGEAASALAEAIAIAGSANDVDAVAGATVTSNAILAAARYIEEAVLLSESTLYQASVVGYNESNVPIVLTAGYQDGVLVYLNIDASAETPKLGGVTAASMQEEMLAAGGAIEIDAYAGSTETASAVLEAFAACEAMIGSPSNLVTVTGSAVGYNLDNDPIVITATYVDGVLSALSIDASAETPKLGGVTAASLQEEILAAGNADSVDIDLYATSTETASAVLEAFAACEAQVG